MIKVLDKVREEKEQDFKYPDEKIFSNLYYVSFSKSLKSLDGMKIEEKEKKCKENNWLLNESSKVQEVFVLDFDNITKALANEKKSCDGLFYNFELQKGQLHYLVEMKNTWKNGKKEILSLLKSEDDDGIYYKVRDSVQSILKELEFGGTQEREELVKNMHFFIVYEGKNNVPARTKIKMPSKVKVECGVERKQKRAGRMDYLTDKGEEELYEQFGRKILKLGLKECNEDTFPGDALPRARKSEKGKTKIRAFSIFSAKDFANIVENGFFDEWNVSDE